MSLLLSQRVLNKTCGKKASRKIINHLTNRLSKVVGINGTRMIHSWHWLIALLVPLSLSISK
jgi:aminoglycoside N3'-acetyltransferase